MSGRGYDKGYDVGYNHGYTKGYEVGLGQGKEGFVRPFEGTSIVIPSYNQRDLLRQCLESIKECTPEPHEIIVVDNGSADGTLEYLKSLGRQVRYYRSEKNLGFAGGVNLGLMMARGTTLLFINNDTVVTAGWLSNLLHCLNHCPNAGLVGSVTNYISGEQLVQTSYNDLDEMRAFAAVQNRRNPDLWGLTGRLTGFCVLMRREFFSRLGYFDEGFLVGNCEDDDFGFRARLLGAELVIAGDSFVHHVGSVSMKSLGERFDEVYSKNLAFYSQKWGDTNAVLAVVKPLHEVGQIRTIDLYPSHVIVKGPGRAAYWIDQGERRLIQGEPPYPAVRLSQIDIRSWPLGCEVKAAEIVRCLTDMAAQGLAADCAMVRTPNGAIYQLRKGMLHLVITPWAMKAWMLDRHAIVNCTEEWVASVPQGLPIIAPPVLRSDML